MWIPNDAWWIDYSDGTHQTVPGEQRWAREDSFQTGGTHYRGIDASGAWDRDIDALPDSRGQDSVLVAVMSDGFGHRSDFFDTTSEVFTSDGYDYWDQNNDPFWQYQTEIKGADQVGTSVSAVVAAVKANSNVYSGIASVRIIPYRVLGDDKVNCDGQNTAWARLSNAMSDATSRGTDVIVMPFVLPLGGCGGSTWGLTASTKSTIEDALKAAYDAGVLMVAPQDTRNGCPDGAGFPATDIHVIATSGYDQITPVAYSNWCYGPEIELSTPAKNLGHYKIKDIDTFPYESADTVTDPILGPGMVGGVAALVKSYRHDLSNEQIRQVLNASAVYKTAGPTLPYAFGWGSLDANKALDLATRLKTRITGDWDDPNAIANDPLQFGEALVDWNTRPAADIDPMGNSHVVWVGKSGQNKVVYLGGIGQTGQVAQSQEVVETGATQADASYYPDVSVDSQGYYHVAWIDYPSAGNGKIIYRKVNPDSQLVNPIIIKDPQIGTTLGRISSLNVLAERGIAPTANAKVYFVYQQVINADPELVMAGINSDGTWALQPKVIANFQGQDRNPSADISQEASAGQCGNSQCVFVAWENVLAGANPQVSFQVFQTSNGAAVSGGTPIDGITADKETHPSISTDFETKDSWIAWSSDNGTNTTVRATRITIDLGVFKDPVTLGIPVANGSTTDNVDPTIYAGVGGYAGLIWSGLDRENGQDGVMYAELSPWLVPTLWSRDRLNGYVGGNQLRAGSTMQTPAFPIVLSAAKRASYEYGTYDRSDGNYRFVWVAHTPLTIVPGTWYIHTSGTRPWFSPLKVLTPQPQGLWLYKNPDIAIDGNGGTHIVFEDASSGASKVRYRYWPVGSSPAYTNPTVDTLVCPNQCPNLATFTPRVLTTGTVWDGQTGIDAHVIFVRGTPGVKNNEVWIARFRAGNGAPVQGPVLFPGDSTGVIATVADLDVLLMRDHTGEVYSVLSIGAVWTELQNGNANTRVVHGAAAIGANAAQVYPAMQTQTDIRVGVNGAGQQTSWARPSIAFGPGGRLYVAFSDVSHSDAFVRMYTVSAQPGGVPTNRWQVQFDVGAEKGLRAVIGVDSDFDVGTTEHSVTTVSDNQIHVVFVLQTQIGATTYYQTRYTRIKDDWNSESSIGTYSTGVNKKSIVAAPPVGVSHDFLSEPVLSMVMRPENRPMLVQSGKKDFGGPFPPFPWVDSVSIVGLSNFGGQDLFSEAHVSRNADWWALAPRMAYRPASGDGSVGGTYGIVYEAETMQNNDIIYFHEAPAVACFG